MNWKRILAYISGSVDQELLLRNEYLTTENRILRDQIKGRLQVNDTNRTRHSRDRQTVCTKNTRRSRPTTDDAIEELIAKPHEFFDHTG